MLYTAKHKNKSPQTRESLFQGDATMAYSMGFPEPDKKYGVDLSTVWSD